jgi:pectin methylesterase-like acyl-CoA thioesterase
MNRLLLLVVGLLLTLTGFAQHVILVEKGNVQSLLDAFKEAATRNNDRDSERLFILIPDGYYDLGETALTRVAGNNIAVIGQSMEGTIIRNAPDKKNEGISRTAVLQNRGKGNYYQDLTLRNDLDYYHAGEDGRAVCMQDKGLRTVYNRVRMLSYQDTFYSDNELCQHYLQDCEIHGTIDFICGAGDVWFEGCRIVTEKRNPDGSGNNIIAAPRTSGTKWGYIFNRCTIENDVSEFNYGRSWHTNPSCVWLYTTLLTPDKLQPTRWDPQGMKVSKCYFREYGTMDARGKDITPKSNVITFTLRDNTLPFESETIMTREELQQYKVDNIFRKWQPVKLLKTMEKQSRKLKKQHNLK